MTGFWAWLNWLPVIILCIPLALMILGGIASLFMDNPDRCTECHWEGGHQKTCSFYRPWR